jgi:hypothetical protein
LLQIAVPRPKLSPPQSSCTSFVYTRTRPPAGTTIAEKVNVGPSSDTSTRRHPFRSRSVSLALTISTYSSGSCLDTTPSKKIQTIDTPPSPAGELGVAVSVGAGVGVGVSVGTAVGNGVGVGVDVGEFVGTGVGVGKGVGDDDTIVGGVDVAAGALVAIGTGVGDGVLVAVAVSVGSGVWVLVGIGDGVGELVGVSVTV